MATVRGRKPTFLDRKIMDEAATMLWNIRMGPDMQKEVPFSKRIRMLEAVRTMKPSDPEAHYVERRKQVHDLSVAIAKLGIVKAEQLKDDFPSYAMAISPLLNWDVAVLTKIVIHFQLFGGTLVELGTERHQKWVDMANEGAFIGGFAMTEIGHGSNVQAIETRADFDLSSNSFILTSPTPSSTKFMIGNVGVHGEVIVLMAQLYIKNECKGVHAFFVQLRSFGDDGLTRGELLPGVELGDVGLKSSWNEVDNAWIRFKGMKIPRENLLNRFADVSSTGEYISSAKTPSKLFAATMAQLTVGRINYIAAPVVGLETALSTAIRYARQRRQFSPAKDSPETPIIEYSTHYSTLMNLMAKTVALQLARGDIVNRLPNARANPNLLPEYHATVSGLKAYVCEFAYIELGHLRVMCGGGGIVLANGIGKLHNYFDVFQTAEGDRVVLYQQLGKFLVSSTAKKFSGINGLVQYGLEIVGQNLIAKNPLLSLVESNSDTSIGSHGFILKALEFRQKLSIREVLVKLQNLTTAPKPLTPAQAWNETLPQVITACDAFLELYIFQMCCNEAKSFETKYLSSGTPSSQSQLAVEMVRECLITTITVAGLGFLKNDFQFFVRNGLFSAARCSAIENVWMSNCKLMSEKHVDLLLASSEVLEEFNNAPQGKPDYVAQMLKAMKPSQAKL